MKIALCISGLARTYEKTYFNLFKNFLSKYDCDVFISTWNTKDFNESKIDKIYSPKILEVEDSMSFDKKYQKNMEDNRPSDNVLSMFYKIKKCNDLKINYEKLNDFKYDICVRWRFDLNLIQEILIPNIIENDILIPKFGNYFGVNDQLSICKSNTMNIYSSLYDNIEKYFDNKICLIPEYVLKHHILTNNININNFEINYNILRENKSYLDNKTLEHQVMNDKFYKKTVTNLLEKLSKK